MRMDLGINKKTFEKSGIDEELFDVKYSDQEKLPGANSDFMSNYQALARAVVTDAAKEYEMKYNAYWWRTHALNDNGEIITFENPRSGGEKASMEQARKWFSSHWCEMLVYFGTDGSDMDGASIPAGLEKIIDKKNREKMREKWKKDQEKKNKQGKTSEEEVSDILNNFRRRVLKEVIS